ncbi:MAG: hypothetical protein QOK43_411 [Acidimicrobiaceae bacterium]|nr:hypothetical protein [Acidimicrobiaceae bacterium]
MWSRGRSTRTVTVMAVLTALVMLAGAVLSAPGAQAGGWIKGANSVTFTYDAGHPDQTVVTSSSVMTRTPGQPVVLTISVAPHGHAAAVRATLRNPSSGPAAFGPGGVVVRAMVTQGRRARGAAWVVRAPGLTGLAPGQSVDVAGVFPLPNPGTYTVTATGLT